MSKVRTYEIDGEAITVESGSGNVFADLGLPNPEERAFKAELALCIRRVMQAKGLTQTELGTLVGLPQPKVSALLRGRLAGFSIDRLLSILNRLGRNVEVRVQEEETADARTILVV